MILKDKDGNLSYMDFGEFDEANCFQVEKIRLYERLKGKGFKVVEFVLHRPETNELLFIEAKTSLAKQFEDNMPEICKKFMDSLQLIGGIWFGEYNAKVELPDNKESFLAYGTQIVFILVVKNLRSKPQAVAECIKQKLKREHLLWRFKIWVMNEATAVKAKLVIVRES